MRGRERSDRGAGSERAVRNETPPRLQQPVSAAVPAPAAPDPSPVTMPPLAVSTTPNPFNPYGVVTKPATPAAPPPDTRTPEEKFNDAYWAHYPPAVQALRDMPQGTDREQAAATLAKAGYVVDVPIQAWGWDPWKTMKLRQEYGMQFVPSALMTASGPLDREVPGALRVSLSAADFPPHGGGTVKY